MLATMQTEINDVLYTYLMIKVLNIRSNKIYQANSPKMIAFLHSYSAFDTTKRTNVRYL